MTIQPLRVPVVTVRDLAVSFSRWGQTVRALDKVSVDVFAGEWVLVVGHNGAGKSTFLNALAGRLRSDAGDVRIGGCQMQHLRGDIADRVFFVHQDPLLGTAPLLTVCENLAVADSAATELQRSRKDVIRRYSDLLQPVGLSTRLKQPAKLLSGGERQLLAMVVAGLRKAPIILLDEPMTALDPAKAQLCIEQISRMHRAHKTIIQVAHDTRFLLDRADRVLTMREGRLVGDERLTTSHVDQLAL